MFTRKKGVSGKKSDKKSEEGNGEEPDGRKNWQSDEDLKRAIREKIAEIKKKLNMEEKEDKMSDVAMREKLEEIKVKLRNEKVRQKLESKVLNQIEDLMTKLDARANTNLSATSGSSKKVKFTFFSI